MTLTALIDGSVLALDDGRRVHFHPRAAVLRDTGIIAYLDAQWTVWQFDPARISCPRQAPIRPQTTRLAQVTSRKTTRTRLKP